MRTSKIASHDKGFSKRLIIKLLIGLFLAILIIPIIFIFGLYMQPKLRAIPEGNAARGIERYPNSTKWKTETRCQDMFQQGPCSAFVYFKTNDSPETVFEYYKKKLGGSGFRSGITNNKVINFYKGNIGAELHVEPNSSNDTNYVFFVNVNQIE